MTFTIAQAGKRGKTLNTFTFLLEHLTAELQALIQTAETTLSNAEGEGATHAIAGIALSLLGVADSVEGYRAMPNLHPRTVRRICAESHLLLSVSSTEEKLQQISHAPPKTETAPANSLKQTKNRVLTDSSTNLLPDDSLKVAELAKKAGVSRVTAHLAATYFRNPLERVLTVLEDLALLREWGGTVNPAALFTWLMRRPTESVKLPLVVMEAREAKLVQLESAEKLKRFTVPGVLTIWLGRTRAVVVQHLERLNSAVIELLEDTEDGYSGSRFTVPLSQLR